MKLNLAKLSEFGRFLAHHVSDLTSVTTALRDIAPHLPIEAQDKARIIGAIDQVDASAANIAKALQTGTAGQVVTVKKSDVTSAVAAFLATDEGKTVLAAAIPAQTPQAPASNTGGAS